MKTTIPDAIQYPILHALVDVLTDPQWGDLFANRLAKRSVAQMLLKHRRTKASYGVVNRLADDIALEMRAFRPIKERKPGEGFVA